MSDVFSQFTEKFPCEAMRGCEFEAAVMVWAQHHQSGCGYTGFRCDIHFNFLVREALREMERIRQCPDGYGAFCDLCGERVELGILSDHLRWIRL